MKKQKLEIRKIRPYMKNAVAIIAMLVWEGIQKYSTLLMLLVERVSLVILINRMEPVMMLAIFR
ncbi:hypothetical protein AGMMS49921_13260 [Endomicrobiia bacterium]|nr:hypothetical protein AGMMS49921_13260 [Endomicrobiia bacterium]